MRIGGSMDVLRIGRISSVNYEAGTARVVYKDRGDCVTMELPLLAYEYAMPEVDDLVLVAHLPNGAEAGVLLGRYWNSQTRPRESGKGLYRKDLDRDGKCFIRYDAESGDLLIHNEGKITVEGSEIKHEKV